MAIILYFFLRLGRRLGGLIYMWVRRSLLQEERTIRVWFDNNCTASKEIAGTYESGNLAALVLAKYRRRDVVLSIYVDLATLQIKEASIHCQQ